MATRVRLWAVVVLLALAVAGYLASLPAAVGELAATDAPGLADLGLTPRGYALYVVVLVSVLAAVHFVVAGLLLRLAGRRGGALSSAVLLTCLGLVFPQTLPALVGQHPGWSVAVEVLERLTVVALTVWALAFPDGRLRRGWPVALVGVVAVVELAGLLGLDPSDGAVALASDVAWAAAVVAAVVVRYRTLRDPAGRAGIRLVAAATGTALTVLVLAAVAQELGARPGTVADLVVQAGIALAFLLIPVAVAAALLRHGMWGVEASVGRAVTYGALGVAAIAAYTAVVAVGTAVLPVEPTTTATVAAGLLALVVHPVYVRVRRGVDRLLYGEPERAVARLASMARESRGDVGAVLQSVCDVVLRTLRLPYVAVSVGPEEEPVAERASGELAPGWPTDVVALHHLGERVGALTVGRRDRDGPAAETDRRAVADVAGQLAVLASSLLLAAELQRSRRRLVTAQEEERRRLRNDLHDGLGPALSAVLMTLSAAENRLASDPAAVPALLDDARRQTAAAVADVRRLVYALRPPALDELGLAGALRGFLAKLDAADIRFRLDLAGDLDDLPAAVEVAAFRIVGEAATNVVRHAGAGSAVVSLRRADDELTVTIADDGRGVSGGPGVGLTSMRERAAELGGTCTVGPGGAGGTVVRATLPLSAAVRGVPVHG